MGQYSKWQAVLVLIETIVYKISIPSFIAGEITPARAEIPSILAGEITPASATAIVYKYINSLNSCR